MGRLNIKKLHKYNTPKIMIHSADPKLTVSQVSFWINEFKTTGVPFSVLTRDENSFEKLSNMYPQDTILYASAPVDVESAVTAQPNLNTVFYLTNRAKNIHLLRFNNLKHIFIGTKNSDWQSIIDKSYRAYDEIWVSGEAMIEKFRESIDNLGHLEFKKIGKPQLKDIVDRTINKQKTDAVLYIPLKENKPNIVYYHHLTNRLMEISKTGLKINLFIDDIAQKENIKNIASEYNIKLNIYTSKEIFDEIAIQSDTIILDDLSKLHPWWLAYNIPIIVNVSDENERIAYGFFDELTYKYCESSELGKLIKDIGEYDILRDKRSQEMERILGIELTLNNNFFKYLKQLRE